MARLGGMSTESFSSARERLYSAASIGLGSILRDQKAMPGTNRMNVLLGLSSQTSAAASRSLLNSPVHSLTSSPIESNGFLDVDDAELNDEDNSGMDIHENGSIHTLDPHRQHRLLPHAAYELGCSHAHTNTLSFHSYGPTHTHSQKHGMSRAMQQLEAPKQAMTTGMDGTRAAHRVGADKASGLTDAISSRVGSVRLSPLSKVSEGEPGLAHQGLATSQAIPVRVDKRTLHDSSLRIAERQSAPVNVPNWSKIRRHSTSNAVNFSSIDEIGEDDDEERLIPPHEMLARESACNQRMTSSVCEGQGRTLKGRDMRRMRNAVWRQTGFAD